ncbi:MAG TPA: serine/threonine-protein kinase [Phycisphaerae bacterium]|nr:serine/threonine-protein kinase [Phycisphaerae bacterium]
MIDERVKKAHAIFVEALSREGADRDAFVADVCADDDSLRGEVNRLLGAVERSTDFLESPAISSDHGTGVTKTRLSIHDVPGYRVLRTLGVGGMASVYEAEQAHPRRLVALKVMHRSLTETSALQRFRFETETLARLKHPGIAQIHEAGTVDDDAGRPVPFFTMELVEGAQPITGYAADANTDFRTRLDMFVAVCEAVRCGHNAGVIHRDLKPSNVLVDKSGAIKVIDFGIARTLGPVESRITLESEREKLIGTLNYMSPEQCVGDDVDTRTDVYALGVMLYELVTGKLPHDLSKTSIPEAARVIQSVAPARPSTVAKDIPGDLELIIMTAIDKDRERRYPSAAELAADIRRFVANVPIQARPPTMLYQARKFAQRHRALVTGGALMVVVLIAAVVVTTRMAIVANRAREAAERRELELKRVTEFQRSQLSGIDVAAMGERLRDTLVEKLSADGMTAREAEGLFESVNFPSVALTLIEENVLERSRAAINERFADQPLLRARLLQTLAGTMGALGLPDRAEPVLQDALAIRRAELGEDSPETLESLQMMGMLLGELGRYDEALKLLEDTYERRKRVLGPDDPDTLSTANSLGGVVRYMGRFEEAQAIWEATLATRRRVLGDDHPETLISLNNVGVIHAYQGDLDGAEVAWRELLERRRRLEGEDHPRFQNVLTNLGLVLVERGKLEEARTLLEESLDGLLKTKGEDHPSTLSTMTSLAELLIDMKDEDGEPLLRRCIDGRTKVLGADHPDTLRVRARLAAWLVQQGNFEQAADELGELLAAQRERLGSDHGDTIESMHYLSLALLGLNRPADAEALANECVERSQKLAPDAKTPNAMFKVGWGRSLVGLKRFAQAETVLLESHRDLDDGLGSDDPRTRESTKALADLYSAWAQAEPDAGHDAQADKWKAQLQP